ncbi:hypothetical protein C8R46DRAFT_136219 [Mycena filopes]|nr:hypothetical protein C8R46DRAFT_136219 [Mycena filopes]
MLGLEPPPATPIDPFLPLELEREIFETAALSSPTTIPTLLRVSRRVFIWIEPLLYRALRVDSPATAAAIERAMQTKPPEFFSDNVRYLYLGKQSDWSFQTACALVQLCSNLASLFFDSWWPELPLLTILDGISRVRMWHGSLRRLIDDDSFDLTHPFFRTITHMNISSQTVPIGLVPSLVAMPALTHLCMYRPFGPDSTGSRILEESPRLQLLLVRGSSIRNISITDVRYVQVVRGPKWDDWVAHDHDIWAKAEAFVARKRRGEIDVNTPWVEPWW